MIENLRKYTGLIIVLFVLVIIGFIFLDTSSMRSAQGGAPVIKVNGASYSDAEYRKIGSSSLELIQGMAGVQDFRLYTFLLSMGVDFRGQSAEAQETFFVNRLQLQNAKERFGIHPSEDAIDSFIRELQVFAGPDGAFSQEGYRNFVEKGIGRFGLIEADVREIASDILAQEKLAEILGSGLSDDRDMVEKQINIDGQEITTELAEISIDPIQSAIDPTEEDIREFWETVQDAFRTNEMRSFTYLVAKPEKTEEAPQIPALLPESTDEQKEEHAAKVADREAAFIEALRQARLKSDGAVHDFITKLGESENPDFEALAKETGFQLIKTEAFPEADAPAPLNGQLRASSSNGTVASELFKITPTDDPFSQFSSGIASGENEWIVAKLDETIPVRVKTYKEARDEARAQLITERASASLKQKAEAAAEKIKTLLAEGKSFSEAAVAAELTIPTLTISDLNRSSQIDTSKAPYNLFNTIRYADPKTVVDPIIESDRAFVVYVADRRIKADPDRATNIDESMSRGEDGNGNRAFTAWLNDKRAAANVEVLGQN